MSEHKKNTVKILEKIQSSNPDTLKFIIPTFMSKNLTTYMLIREDLIFVKETANILKGIDKLKIKENLWYSLIAIYGRCFTDSSKTKKPKLEAKDFFNFEKSAQILKTHEKLINIRHTFLAHRGDNENEIPVLYLELPKNEDINDSNVHFSITSTRYTTESKEFLDDVEQLCNFILSKLDKKYKKKADKLLGAVLKIDKKDLGHLLI